MFGNNTVYRLWWLLFIALRFVPCAAQETKEGIITPEALKGWTFLYSNPVISPDGQYAAWSSNGNVFEVSVRALYGSWRTVLIDDGRNGFFDTASKQYIYPHKDELHLLRLGTTQVRMLPNILSWQQDGQGRWLAWQDSDGFKLENLITGKTQTLNVLHDFQFDASGQWLVGYTGADSSALELFNLDTGRGITYKDVKSHVLHEGGRFLLLETATEEGRLLQHITLSTRKKTEIYRTQAGETLHSPAFDITGSKVVFVTADAKDARTIRLYENGGKPVRRVADDRSLGIPKGFQLALWGGHFTRDGLYLLIRLLRAPDTRMPTGSGVFVDVWSHQNQRLYTAEPVADDYESLPAVVPVSGGQVVPLIKDEFEIVDEQTGIAGGYAVVRKGQVGERFWEHHRDSVWLVSLTDGKRTLLPFIKASWVELDSSGTAVVGFDAHRGRHYYRYDIATGKETKLTADVPDWTLGVEHPFWLGWDETEKNVNHSLAGRLADGPSILTYDNFDIWQVDLSGRNPAVNVTNGYGRKHRTVFRMAMPGDERLSKDAHLLLSAFNERNKDNGFYRKRLGRPGDPDSLYMGPYYFAHDRKVANNLNPHPYGTGMTPIKAEKADAWVVKRESATEAPNWFYTQDFRTYEALTDVQPHRDKGLNWYTTELVDYTQEDGVQSQGVLYKPADFDPKKKYPVLFYYYEQYSYGLNAFIPPAVSEAGKPNIPWYVSRGYLVFTPDNYFRRGWRQRSVLCSVEGAAHELTQRPYVDGQRMGIMGLSQGGAFTNYIITHSNLFAAAFEGCGAANLVSSVLQWAQLNGEGGSRIGGEQWTGTNMWESPAYWVNESPVVNAHKVTTPLLIMHNRQDGAVLFEQAVEMFTALWRNNKRVWLLQYDEGSHGVGGKDALDLTTRMTQYFDHYLKGLPPPRWMTQGVPRYLKGIEARYELDPAGSCGKDCGICREKQYEILTQ